MKQQIEQAIKEVLEKNGYAIRSLYLEGEIEDKEMINKIVTLSIRASK